jgi:hypothetical protein
VIQQKMFFRNLSNFSFDKTIVATLPLAATIGARLSNPTGTANKKAVLHARAALF